MKRILWVPAFILGVPVLGVGIPFAWIWIASRLQHGFGGIGLLPILALVLGIFGTYVLVTLVAQLLNPRPRDFAHRRRASWTHPVSGERRGARRETTGIEALFITTTVLVAAAFEIYLIFFAHPGVPSGP